MDRCHACAENEAADLGEDAFGVAELVTGYVRLNPTQYYRGATFFVARRCIAELHEFDTDERVEHMLDLVAVSQAVHVGFGPRKLNYEALGNSVPHLHWWITPRHHDDPRPGGPIWEDLDFLRAQWTGSHRLPEAELGAVRVTLLEALKRHNDRVVRVLC